MIENKDIPDEFVSIRQVWLRQINRCTEAITNRYKNDVTTATHTPVSDIGVNTVIESVITLYYTLVDYGEATIKTEVKNKLHEYQSNDDFKKKDFHYFKRLFEFIIETLNKYGMLFDSKPKGYSNTIMKSVKMEENNEKN